MKNLLFLFFIFTSLLSCTSDADDMYQETTHALVGTWQRVDSNNSFENKFIFNADNTGIKIFSENFDDGTAISNATSLEWHTVNDQLTLLILEEINTAYYFNAEGQLVLSAVSEFPFVRID